MENKRKFTKNLIFEEKNVEQCAQVIMIILKPEELESATISKSNSCYFMLILWQQVIFFFFQCAIYCVCNYSYSLFQYLGCTVIYQMERCPVKLDYPGKFKSPYQYYIATYSKGVESFTLMLLRIIQTLVNKPFESKSNGGKLNPHHTCAKCRR